MGSGTVCLSFAVHLFEAAVSLQLELADCAGVAGQRALGTLSAHRPQPAFYGALGI